MKRKITVPKRNPFVALALKRKAGVHQKSNKALRRLEKSKRQTSSDSVFDQVDYLKAYTQMCF